MDWTRRVWTVLGLFTLAITILVVLIETSEPTGEAGPWDELGGLLAALPLLGLWGTTAREFNAFCFTVAAVALPAWLILRLLG
jgi:hypothetical protein